MRAQRLRRQSLRLGGHDYRQSGRYFITIVAAGREEVFGSVIDGIVHHSAEGECVGEVWGGLPRHYRHVALDAFVVMPNHVHGIVILEPAGTPTEKRAPLSEVVRGFKTFSARRVNGLRGVSGAPLWQRNYYERIIRDERELQTVRRYIADNPARWADDVENPRQFR